MTLDDAWAEAEAALPEWWMLHLVSFGPPGPFNPAPDQPFGRERYGATAKPGLDSHHRNALSGDGPTPAAALRALAEKLRERAA